MGNDRIIIHPDIQKALAGGKPVVALESTIIAHGMPYPDNLAMAREVEAIIRAEGAVPATIAVLNGRPHIGLGDADLSRFAEQGQRIMKLSTRDLPYAIVKGIDGATTVASTMHIAAEGGIKVFATGGIGGVHRGAEHSFDISADLFEFSKSDVAVVTAGAKAILDLPLTLEKLESLGVPVIGFGADEFPAFYSRSSGLALTQRCDRPEEVALLMQAKWQMGLAGGIVIANPIPEGNQIPAQYIAPVIERAIAEAEAGHITGKKVTPFLLERLAQVTEGRSLSANIALVKHNARVAAQIAQAYAKLQ